MPRLCGFSVYLSCASFRVRRSRSSYLVFSTRLFPLYPFLPFIPHTGTCCAIACDHVQARPQQAAYVGVQSCRSKSIIAHWDRQHTDSEQDKPSWISRPQPKRFLSIHEYLSANLLKTVSMAFQVSVGQFVDKSPVWDRRSKRRGSKDGG